MPANLARSDPPKGKYVETLKSSDLDRVVGYRLRGASSGPNVLVAGHSPVADLIYERFMELPTLPWMRGTISLITLDQLDSREPGQALRFGPAERVDEILFLPFRPEPETCAAAVQDGYWSILRLCASLGMIDGRGVRRVEPR